jgi:ABC transport system ATP-binding/permease protein
MVRSVFCISCGAPISDEWSYCQSCGSRQPVQEQSDTASAKRGQSRAADSREPGDSIDTPTVELAGHALTLGRSTDCDVVLAERSVSGRHVELAVTDQGVRFRDLGSTAGTRINGGPSQGGLLTEGDELGIGPHSWTLKGTQLVPAGREPPPLEAQAIEVEVAGVGLLERTSLSVDEGELLAIIGPSGSGKSTLLKVLAGIRPSSGGIVLVRGDDVAVRQEAIGYVPQDDTVHHLLTVREALVFAARLRLPEDHAAEGRDQAIDGVLEQVGLADISSRRVGDLSGGQRKRAAVAVELISQPELLLLDEPTTGLDPGLERRLMQLCRHLADAGQTVVLVTHATQSLDLCDRVAIMAPGGRLSYLGSPAGVVEKFGVARVDEIYAGLASDRDENEVSSAAVATPLSPARPAAARAVPRRRIWPQIPVLAWRYSLLLFRDRRNTKILATQVVILAFGSALLFGGDVFAYRDGVALHAGQSAQLLFLMVTVSIWFGATSSVRQVVAERAVLARELAAGVRTEAYLVSKGLVIGAVAALQTVILVWIVFLLRPLEAAPAGAERSIALICVLVAWVGVGIGLALSAFARSEDQATSFLPLILLPQLLFGGAIVATAELGQPIRALSQLAASQWGFAGAGNAIDMNGRIAADPVFQPASRYGTDFFNAGEPQVALALVLMMLACAAVLQARLRPSFEDTWWRQGRDWIERKLYETRGI